MTIGFGGDLNIAKRRAEDRLNKPASDMDMERARISLLRAIARLDIAKHNRPRR